MPLGDELANVLRDPLFLGFLSIAISFYLYYAAKARRRFVLRVSSEYRPAETGTSEVDVTVRYIGNEPIKKEDFDGPLTMQFRGARITQAKINHRRPPGLSAQLSEPQNGVRLTEALWNPGDQLSLRFELNGRPSSVMIDGHVAGVKTLPHTARIRSTPRSWVDKLTEAAEDNWTALLVVASLVAVFAPVLAGALSISLPSGPPDPSLILVAILTIIVMLRNAREQISEFSARRLRK